VFLVGRSQTDCFVKFNDSVMVRRLDGCKEVGYIGLIGDVFSIPLREGVSGCLNGLGEGDDPIPMGPDCSRALGSLDCELEELSEVV